MRRFLIFLLVVLLIANAAVIGAWFYRDDLQAAGVLPAADVPTRADFPETALPAPGVEPEGEPAVPELLACVLVGAFEQRQSAVEASNRIAEQAEAASVLAESVAGEPDYLVFVVPAADTSAKDLASALQAQDVSSFAIPSGERAGNVSVGVFGSQERAQAHQTRVAGLGYDARMATIERKRSVYRVRVQNVPPAALGDLPHEPCGDEQPPDAAPSKDAATPLADNPPAQ